MRRENLWLSLTAATFAGLTLTFGVCTYHFASQAQLSQKQSAQLANELTAATKAQEISLTTIDELKRIITDRRFAELDDIRRDHLRDIQQVAAQPSAEDRPAYRRLLGHLLTAIRATATREMQLRGELTLLQDQLHQLRTEGDARVNIASAHAAELEQELTATHQSHKVQLAKLVEQMERYAALLDRKGKDFVELLASRDTLEKELGKKLGEAENRYSAMRNRWEATQQEAFETPAGSITAIAGRERIVILNLGSADLLPRGLVFNVYDEMTRTTTAPRAKAKVEVTKILGAHAAEARIVEDKLSDPILTGDLVNTPLWQPGKERRFALAGLLDLDGDGQDDTPRILSMINLSGGKVDAQVDLQGVRTGEISIDTRYIIIGVRPRKVDRERGSADAYDKLVHEAHRLSIDILSLDKLQSLHANTQTRVVRLDNSSAAPFRKRAAK